MAEASRTEWTVAGTADALPPIIEDLDFARLYRNHMARAGQSPKQASDWDARVRSGRQPSPAGGYAEAFVARMDLAGASSFEVFAARVSWTYPDLTADELERLRTWYDAKPVRAASGGVAMRWAYIYWDKPIS